MKEELRGIFYRSISLEKEVFFVFFLLFFYKTCNYSNHNKYNSYLLSSKIHKKDRKPSFLWIIISVFLFICSSVHITIPAYWMSVILFKEQFTQK